MAKCIDVNLPIEVLKEYIDDIPSEFHTPAEEITYEVERKMINSFIHILEKLPAIDIDIEPIRHGKWKSVKCSRCGASMAIEDWDGNWIDTEEQNYCYACGAKMDME